MTKTDNIQTRTLVSHERVEYYVSERLLIQAWQPACATVYLRVSELESEIQDLAWEKINL